MRNILLLFGLIALFFGWNAPNHYLPWTTFHLELAATVGLVFLFVSVALPRPAKAAGTAGRPRALPLPLPPASWGWIVIALLPFLQLLAGQLHYRGDAVLGFLYALGAGLAVYTGCLWTLREGRVPVLRSLFVTLAFGAIFSAGLGLAQWLRIGWGSWWAIELIDDRPFANFAQPNHFGLLMVLGIVAMTALFEMGEIRRRAVFYLGLAFLGGGAAISQSRGSLCALVIVVVCWAMTSRRAPTRLRWGEVATLFVAWLLLWGFLGHIEDALYLAKNVELRPPLVLGSRKLIWLHYLTAIGERPWGGYGFSQSVMALGEVATKVAPSENATYAHNVLLDLMVWFGVPAALLMSCAFLVWVLRWLRRVDDPQWTQQRFLVFAVWAALTVQSLLEFPYAHTYFLLPACLLAGAVTAWPRNPDVLQSSARASFPALGWAVAGMLLLGALARDYVLLEDDFRFNRFVRLNFVGTDQEAHEATKQVFVLDQLQELNVTTAYKIRSGMPEEQIEAMRRVARRFYQLRNRLDYAKALALNGRMGEAEGEMLRVRAVFPDVFYTPIENVWKDWLIENQAEIAASARPAASAPR
jgi:O-antigen ligase